MRPVIGSREDITLLQKIEAISTISHEIIERIRNKKKVVVDYNYEVQISDQYLFKVIEKKEEIEAPSIVSIWEPNVKMIVIPDLFKDKIDYNCSNFSDVVRLNGEMLTVVQQYKMFGGSTEAIEVIEKFKNNFELLQVCLGNLEEMLMDTESKMNNLQNDVKRVNLQVETLLKNVKASSTEKKWTGKYQSLIESKKDKSLIESKTNNTLNNVILVGEKDWIGRQYGYSTSTVVMRGLPCPQDGEVTELCLAVKNTGQKANCLIYIVDLDGNSICSLSSPCSVTIDYVVKGWQTISIPPTPIKKGQYLCIHNTSFNWDFCHSRDKPGDQLHNDEIPKIGSPLKEDKSYRICCCYTIRAK